MKNSSDIIIRPLLTEKMSRLEESERKYAFQVTKKTNKIEVKPIDIIDKEDNIFDIGPKTRLKFYNEIVKTEKLLWNGPLGYFEKKPFDEGTAFVVKAVKNNKNKNFFSVAGGGDTISLLKQINAFHYFSFISTGGGAFLEFIKGDGLPGLDSLNK